MSTLTLTRGPLTLTLGRGGGVVQGLRWGDQPLLWEGGERSWDGRQGRRDPATPLACSARYSGAYPLLPYPGRLQDGALRFQGQAWSLPAHPLTAPHALHGTGWERTWAVTAEGPSMLTLALRHAGDVHWPFAFTATQTFILTSQGLTLELALRNDHGGPAPAQLGWHPYFPSRGATLETRFHHRWDPDHRDLPQRRTPIAGPQRWAVKDTDWDHCFEGPRQARLNWPTHGLRLAWSSTPRSPFRGAVLYLPRNADFFCCEPVTACPNALASAEPGARGVVTLAPGERLRLSLTLQAIGLAP